MKYPVYDGVGNREKFLTHTSSALEVVEEMRIKKEYDACMADVEQAKNAVEQAKSRLKDAKDFLKTVKEVDSELYSACSPVNGGHSGSSLRRRSHRLSLSS